MQEQQQLTNLRNLNPAKQIIEVEHSNLPTSETMLGSGSRQSVEKLQQNQQQEGHQHGQSCKHDHGHKKGKKRSGQKNYGIIFYCVFTCLSCLYLQVFCFHPLEEDQNKRAIKSFLTVLVIFMAQWSYFQTVTTDNKVKQLKGTPNLLTDSQTESNYLAKECNMCKYPKAPRVSHCSTCQSCIMKLDHHCMWTQNCIGYRNQRPFYLFTLYMTLGLYHFWTATFSAFGHMYGSCKFFQFFEPGVYVLWVITCFSAAVVGAMIVMLCFSHTFMIITNHTTLMSMKFKRACPLPFIECRDVVIDDEHLNTFDRGEIQNLRGLFGTSILLAFLPFSRPVQNDFLFQTPSPVPTKGQIADLNGGADVEIKRDQELRATISRLKELFKGQKFTFNSQILQNNSGTKIRSSFGSQKFIAGYSYYLENMYKPSRFQAERLPLNIYHWHYLKKVRVEGRFLMTEPMFRQENLNFHFGISLADKSEIVANSIQVSEALQARRRSKKTHSFIPEVLWEGVIPMKSVQYRLRAFRKNGCLLTQFLGQFQSISITTMYIIFILLIQLLNKIHAAKGNLQYIDVRTLLLVQNPDKNTLMLQLFNINCIEFRNNQRTIFPVEEDPIPKSEFIYNSLMKKNSLQEAPSKASKKRDLKIIFEKLIEIEKEFKSREEKEQKCEFEGFIKQLVNFINKNGDDSGSINTKILEIMNNYFEQNKINIEEENKACRETVTRITQRNRQNLQHFCEEYQIREKVVDPLGYSEEQCDSINQEYDSEQETQVDWLIQRHTLDPKIGRSAGNIR